MRRAYCIRSCVNEDKATTEEDAGEMRRSRAGAKGSKGVRSGRKLLKEEGEEMGR